MGPIALERPARGYRATVDDGRWSRGRVRRDPPTVTRAWFRAAAGGIRGANLAVAMGLGLAATRPALAQDARNQLGDGPLFRNDVAGTRIDPQFATEAIHLGSLTIDPTVALSASYDSNIFNQADARSDGSALLNPHVAIRSDWTRNSLSVDLDGTARRYAHFTSEDAEGYRLNARGEMEVGGRTTLALGTSTARVPEERGTGGVGLLNAEPIIRRETSGSVSATVLLGGVSVSANGYALRQRYDAVRLRAGGRASQAFRDTDAYAGDVEVAVPLNGDLVGTIDAGYDRDDSVVDAASSRDSHGVSVQGGLRGYLSQLIAAEIAVGYRTRSYDDPRYRDFKGLRYSAVVDWYALELVSLRARAERYFVNSGLSGSAGADVKNTTLNVFYDPTPRLSTTFTGSRRHERYRDSSLTVDVTELQLSALYRLRPQLGATISGGWRHLSSTQQAILQTYSGTNIAVDLRYHF